MAVFSPGRRKWLLSIFPDKQPRAETPGANEAGPEVPDKKSQAASRQQTNRLVKLAQRVAGGTTSLDEGGHVQRHRWYAFIDGPQNHDGNREPFTKPGQALLWLAATIVFAIFWIGLVALVFLLIPGSRVAAAGIAGLLLPGRWPTCASCVHRGNPCQPGFRSRHQKEPG